MFRISMLPAEDGDCFVVELGGTEDGYRILIDGGRASTGCGALTSFVGSMPRRPDRPEIDLMVLTHVDADHIEGLLGLLATEASLTLGDVWFNGRDQIAAARGIKVPAPVPAVRPERGGNAIRALSIAQGDAFGRLLRDRNWPWNKAFAPSPVMIDPEGPLPRIDLPGGGALTLLGPLRSKLVAFAPEWARWFKRMGAQDEAVLRGRFRPQPSVKTLPAIAMQQNSPDMAKPNGTSIAFVVEYDRRRALFTADAHPGDLAAALSRFAPGADRIHFHAIKVPHHGSAANNTSALIDRLTSPLWLVSTNGSRHEHPDPEAIARIVLAPEEGKTIAFNYRTDFNSVWARDDLRSAYRYCPQYGKNGRVHTVDVA